MINFRLIQCMAMLTASTLEPYLYVLDTRTTLLSDPAFSYGQRIRLSVQPATGTTGTLTVLGTPDAPDASGRMYRSYSVEIIASDSIEVARFDDSSKSVYRLELTDGQSSQLPLPGSGYTFVVNTDETGSRWTIETYSYPTWDLGTIVATLEEVGEPVLLTIFGIVPIEPYKTFRAIWDVKRAPLPERLSAMLLAIALRMEEVRLGG